MGICVWILLCILMKIQICISNIPLLVWSSRCGEANPFRCQSASNNHVWLDGRLHTVRSLSEPPVIRVNALEEKAFFMRTGGLMVTWRAPPWTTRAAAFNHPSKANLPNDFRNQVLNQPVQIKSNRHLGAYKLFQNTIVFSLKQAIEIWPQSSPDIWQALRSMTRFCSTVSSKFWRLVGSFKSR